MGHNYARRLRAKSTLMYKILNDDTAPKVTRPGDTQVEATPSLTTIAGDLNSSATTFAETLERALPRAMSRSTANGTHARLTTIPHTELEASNAPKRRNVFHQGHLGDSRAVKESWETRMGGPSAPP